MVTALAIEVGSYCMITLYSHRHGYSWMTRLSQSLAPTLCSHSKPRSHCELPQTASVGTGRCVTLREMRVALRMDMQSWMNSRLIHDCSGAMPERLYYIPLCALAINCFGFVLASTSNSDKKSKE